MRGTLTVLSLMLFAGLLSGEVQPKIPFCLINYNTAPRTNILIIDNSLKRLWVYDNHRPKPLESFEFQGDGIPIGIFFFKRVLMGTEVPESTPLSSKVYALDFPNPVDRREQAGHSSLYLYGCQGNFQPRKPVGGPLSITLSEVDVSRLSRYILLDYTPLIVCNKVRFVTAERLNRMRTSFVRKLSAWRACKEKQDLQGLKGIYSSGLTGHGANWPQNSRLLALHLDAINIYYCGQYYTAVFNRLVINDRDCFYDKITQYWLHRPHESKIVAESIIPLTEPLDVKLSTGESVSIQKYQRDLLQKLENSTRRIMPVHIGLEDISISPDVVRLNINLSQHGIGLACIPVMILEENHETEYYSLPGVSLKKGIPIDYKNAIHLKKGSNLLRVAKGESQSVRSVTLFVVGQDGELRQIKTYFINGKSE